MSFTKQDIIDAIKTVFDPEVPVNIWDLGLVYDIAIKPDSVIITMTFTSPTCPMMEDLLSQVKQVVANVVGDKIRTDVNLVWDPAWNISMMSPQARVELDLTDQGW